jgi:hypothetical protein
MKFELWSAESGNRLGGFDNLDELGAVVRDYGELNGEQSIADLFAEQWPFGAHDPSRILTGHDLQRLARPMVRTRTYTSAPATQAVASASRQIRYGLVEVAV